MQVAGFSLTRIRLPEASCRLRVLQDIEQARTHFAPALRVIGPTYGRYNGWTREESGLDDLESCPKALLQQLHRKSTRFAGR